MEAKQTLFLPADSRSTVVSYLKKYVHEVLVNGLGGLSMPWKSVIMLTDIPDLTIAVYGGCKAIQKQHELLPLKVFRFILNFGLNTNLHVAAKMLLQSFISPFSLHHIVV